MFRGHTSMCSSQSSPPGPGEKAEQSQRSWTMYSVYQVIFSTGLYLFFYLFTVTNQTPNTRLKISFLSNVHWVVLPNCWVKLNKNLPQCRKKNKTQRQRYIFFSNRVEVVNGERLDLSGWLKKEKQDQEQNVVSAAVGECRREWCMRREKIKEETEHG